MRIRMKKDADYVGGSVPCRVPSAARVMEFQPQKSTSIPNLVDVPHGSFEDVTTVRTCVFVLRV